MPGNRTWPSVSWANHKSVSATLLGICAMIYLGVAIDFYAAHNYGMALAFFAYALANVGFICATP